MRAVLLSSLLLLTACGYESPTWMPAGYAYHNDYYKAQPGPEADTLGYDYTPARNDYIGTMWRDVADALVTDLENKTGMSAQPVYVERLPSANAFNLSLDNALRDELRERGYTLVTSKQDAVGIQYQAFKAEDEGKRNDVGYNGDADEQLKPFNPEKSERFTFVLTLVDNGAAFGEIRRTELLPGYGYVSGEGNLVPAPRILEGEVQEPVAQPVELTND
jgi:hypothetical protein